MNSHKLATMYLLCVFLTFILLLVVISANSSDDEISTPQTWTPQSQTEDPKRRFGYTRKICISHDRMLRAKKKSCFLRPDTGPCRADIPQWYFDPKQLRCYRFFYGGCQGNGNRFETHRQCRDHCFLNETNPDQKVRPAFCDVKYEYGTCFGYFNRWAWDRFTRTCQRRIYSGCGGNQNNFESLGECQKNCLMMPNNTLGLLYQFTTCIPFRVPDMF